MTELRRRELLLGAGAASLVHLVGCGGEPAARVVATPGPTALVRPPPPAGVVLAYFGAFGVDQRMIAEGISAALARGADRADLYFEHRVSTWVSLEDGEVNRAYTSVDLGVGVRAVKGDQTGYGYTEELTLEAVRRAASTAAAVANGPSRSAPLAFHVGELPKRYPTKTPWESVKTSHRLPILMGINERALAADKRIKKVRASMSDQYGAILFVDSEGEFA